MDALGYADRLHVPDDVGHDCNQLLVNVFGLLRSVAVHQRTVQMLQTQEKEVRKSRGEIPGLFFVLLHSLVDCPVDESIDRFTLGFCMFLDLGFHTGTNPDLDLFKLGQVPFIRRLALFIVLRHCDTPPILYVFGLYHARWWQYMLSCKFNIPFSRNRIALHASMYYTVPIN